MRSLKRLQSTHRLIGTVSHKPIDPGRPRLLISMDVKVYLLSPFSITAITDHPLTALQFLFDCVDRKQDRFYVAC